MNVFSAIPLCDTYDVSSLPAIRDGAWNLAEVYPARFDEWFDCLWAAPRELVLLSLSIDPKSAIAAAELVQVNGEAPCFGMHEGEYQRRLEAVRHALQAGRLVTESLDGRVSISVTAFLRWAGASSWQMSPVLSPLVRHQARVERQNHIVGSGMRTGLRAETQERHRLYAEIAWLVASENPRLRRSDLSRRVAREVTAKIPESVSASTVRNVLFYNEDAPLRGAAWRTFQAKARDEHRNRIIGRRVS